MSDLQPDSSARPKVLVIAGPTGVGKTDLSLVLAGRFGAEIVNADSMQVYRYMDVGTAKPGADDLARAVHHLIDVVDPDEPFDAAAYLNLARPIIADLNRRGKPAIIVGGTGLYLRSLIRGLFEGPGRDDVVRERLKTEARDRGRPALYARLAEADPEAAKRIHPNDIVRLVRALEVFDVTGRPISSFQDEHALKDRPYETLFFCLNRSRAELYARIDERTEAMYAGGLLEEVRGLLDRGYSPDLKPMRAIGYKEAVRCLAGRLSPEEAVRETAIQTRRYAKRQITWYRAQPEVIWLSPEEIERAVELAEEFLGGAEKW